MNAQVITSPRWSTSSFSHAPGTSPMELDDLGAHVMRCNGMRGRWFVLRCAADGVNDFVRRHIVTSLVLASALIGIGSLL